MIVRGAPPASLFNSRVNGDCSKALASGGNRSCTGLPIALLRAYTASMSVCAISTDVCTQLFVRRQHKAVIVFERAKTIS